jgi:dTDP-glucose 4,6-dehydratase
MLLLGIECQIDQLIPSLKEWIDHYIWQGVDIFYITTHSSLVISYLEPYLFNCSRVIKINESARDCHWLIKADINAYWYARKRGTNIKDYLLTLDYCKVSNINLKSVTFAPHPPNSGRPVSPIRDCYIFFHDGYKVECEIINTSLCSGIILNPESELKVNYYDPNCPPLDFPIPDECPPLTDFHLHSDWELESLVTEDDPIKEKTYTPKNILLTGGAGFIGSHTLMRLVKNYPEYNVYNFDSLEYCASLENIKKLEKYNNYEFIKGSICSSDFVVHILKSRKIDTIIHFAAQTHVDNSFGNSIEFTQTNVMGTHVLLEAANSCGIKRFIHVSTDEVYGDHAKNEEHEERVLEPTNPYAATKAAAEFISKSYLRSFGLPLIITRGNNVYGPHQYPEKLIPKSICRLQRGQPICLHGDGHNERCYVYVEDVAEAFDIILHYGNIGQIYDIGTGHKHSNNEVAKDIIRLMDCDEKDMIIRVSDRKYNDRRYDIDPTKIYELGWRPKTLWIDGLKKTIEWYKENCKNWGEDSLEKALNPHPIIK